MYDNLERPHSLNYYSTKDLTFCCLLVFLSLASPVAAQWTAPNFEVIPVDPFEKLAAANNGKIPKDSKIPRLDLLVPQGSVANPAITEATVTLTESGALYAKGHLNEPSFGPMVSPTTRGIFIFTFPGSIGDPDTKDALGFFLPATCQTAFQESWMAVNTNSSGIEQYQTLAHELFHAIQWQYPFQQERCGDQVIDWIDEGTADAAGIFLAEKKMKKDGLPFPEEDNSKFYGIRPYDVPLYHDESWNTPEVKERFETKIKVYKEEKIYEYFGYRTSSFWRFLMDRYGKISTRHSFEIARLQALSEAFMERKGLTGNNIVAEEWAGWVAAGVEVKFGKFQHAYGEFLSEFAAWSGSKYSKLTADSLLKKSFGGCEKVSLSYTNKNTASFTLTPHKGLMKALYPLAGRCIQVTVENIKKGHALKLMLEVDAKSSHIADQLVLGFAREEHEVAGANQQGPYKHIILDHDCYSHARKYRNRVFPCLFYGKVQEVKGKKNTNGIRTWRFESKKVKRSNLTVTLILTNVRSSEPKLTKEIENLDITVGFPKSQGGTMKGARLDLPESFNLGQLPDANIPRRQALYGIKKNSAVSTQYSMGLSPIQVAALDEAGNKTETYAITPIEPVAFGQTGPLKAMVMVGSGGLSAGTIGSQFCKPSSEPGAIGKITKSDDEALEILIDTPLCQLSIANMAQCKNGCPVVDHFKGILSLPFGWRYFSENKIEDLVTPGVLLDIDRYHHNAFGTPLQGLRGSGSPEHGTGGGGNSGSGSEGRQDGDAVGSRPCDCSCSTFKLLKQAKDMKPPNFDLIGQMFRCAQTCAKPWRDCRRAMKKR